MAEETNTELNEEEGTGYAPTNTPTSYTNEIITNVSKDSSVVLVHLLSDLPTLKSENHRTIITKNTAIQLIDELAEYLDHYPKKPRKKPATKKTPSKAKK